MVRWPWLVAGLLPLVVLAADKTEPPSLELLEFMGTWETRDGEWLDPLALLEKGDADGQRAQIEDGKHD